MQRISTNAYHSVLQGETTKTKNPKISLIFFKLTDYYKFSESVKKTILPLCSVLVDLPTICWLDGKFYRALIFSFLNWFWTFYDHIHWEFLFRLYYSAARWYTADKTLITSTAYISQGRYLLMNFHPMKDNKNQYIFTYYIFPLFCWCHF